MLLDYNQPLRMNLCLVSFIFQLQSQSTCTTVHDNEFLGLIYQITTILPKRLSHSSPCCKNRCLIVRYDLLSTYRRLIRNTFKIQITDRLWSFLFASSECTNKQMYARRVTAFLKTTISLCQDNSNRNCVRSGGVQ